MGKMLSEVEWSYIAGLIDADGAIMALIERHKEKRFGFRVRIEIKLTQKQPEILNWFKEKLQTGSVRKNRTTFDWLTRDQKEISRLLTLLYPFLRIKKEQAKLALEIINTPVKTKKDLLEKTHLADSLSLVNPRSRNRRKNFAVMVEDCISPND